MTDREVFSYGLMIAALALVALVALGLTLSQPGPYA